MGEKTSLSDNSFRIVAAEQLGKLKNGTSKRDFKNEIPTIGEKATLSLTISSLFPHLKLRGFPGYETLVPQNIPLKYSQKFFMF